MKEILNCLCKFNIRVNDSERDVRKISTRKFIYEWQRKEF